MTKLELRGLSAELMLQTATNLRDRSVDISRRIHDSRRRFKEIRALLRLFRDQLGENFQRENHFYRDVGRAIAAYREADTAAVAVKRIEGLPDKHLTRLQQLVRKEQRSAYQNREEAEAILENVAALIGDAVQRLPTARRSTERGLKRTIRTGKRAMREAYDSMNAIAFHEWRKRVKDHLFQLQFLSITKGQKRLLAASQILGEHHDLEVIRDIVTSAETVFSQEEAAEIDAILVARQSRLAKKVKSIGEKIYG